MKIRSELSAPTKSYAANTPEAGSDILDCSLGENPYGFPDTVPPVIAAFDLARLAHYPHSHAATDAIIRYWSDYAQLSSENITLCDGSIGALYLINNIFAAPSAEVVGFAPTFTDMMVNVGMSGMGFRAVSMEGENFKASVDRIIEAISPETSMVYVDSPNNPTGQIIPAAELARLADAAAEMGAALVVDEAYGDFVPRGESALTLMKEHSNLIVVRTFSKGFGLAGLRAGCIIAPPEITEAIAKVSNPYMMNELTREAVAAALAAEDFPASHAEDFADVKRKIAASIGNKLTMLETDWRVPICTLRHSDPNADLQRLLLKEGVLTVSGIEFEGLGSGYVRLRAPKPEDAEPLLKAVRAVDRA